MRPTNALDWVALVLLWISAFSWAYFVTDVNILDKLLEPIADVLDDIVFVLIGLAGVYSIIRAFSAPPRT